MDIWNSIKTNFILPIVKSIGNIINYQEKDPTTPNVVVKMEIPALPNPCPPFAVEGFTGADGIPDSVEHQAAGVYTTIVLSLRYAQSILQPPIIRWPALTKLIANPRAGKMFNAYYDRYYLNFFYDDDPIRNRTIFTCESSDVVAHELGHAILDCIRPDLWAVQCVEIQAFHEAFGDINALITSFTFTDLVKTALAEINGDLKQPNIISGIAEEMGIAILHATQGNVPIPPHVALRQAANQLQYVPPETLPTRAAGDALAGEPHSFSRIFVGAWYDSFVNVYEAVKTMGKTPEEAVYIARDKMARITYNGVRLARVDARFFGSVLKAMLIYDQQNGLMCGPYIRSGFANHGLIVGDKLTMQDITPIDAMNMNASNNSETARISDFGDNDCPLFDFVVELASRAPSPTYMDADVSSLQEAIQAARHSLRVLHEHDRVGVGPTVGKIHDKEFTVIDGKLVRNYYCCSFCRE